MQHAYFGTEVSNNFRYMAGHHGNVLEGARAASTCCFQMASFRQASEKPGLERRLSAAVKKTIVSSAWPVV